MSGPKRLFVFDRYRLDPQERQLMCGSDVVPLPPKLFDLLATLVEKPERLLRKEDLLDAVWRGIAVEEGSLTRSISSLRRVLGTTNDGRDFIQTVSKRGYRFVVAVRQTTSEEGGDAGLTSGPPLPAPVAACDAVEFVGRETDLRQVTQVWERATAGRHQLVLVAGEAGIGKTRLAVEFARRRAAEGTVVLFGSSDEESLVPYQPFVESLAWYLRHCPDAELRAHLGAIGGGAELGAVLPELHSRVPDLPPSAAADPEGQRYRLFESVAALFAVAARDCPMLLVIDDLHWADKTTLLMLRHVIRSSRAARFCIVATYRESEVDRAHPLAEMIATLRREPRVTRLVLRGLDIAHVAALVDSIIGPAAPPQLARVIMESTDGNPFFATETLLHLKETDALATYGAANGRTIELVSLGVPEGIRALIGSRLARLSDGCNRVLRVAAVIGRQFEPAVLEAVSETPEGELLDALEEATRAQLVVESPKASGRFEFTHALIRQTIYTELSSPRRASLHRRVAETIERQADGASGPPLAELAYHFFHAASTGTADKAIDYAARAGDRAAEGLAQEEAARLFDIALRALDFRTTDTETSRLRVDLHSRRARCFDAVNQWALEVRELQAAIGQLAPDQKERRCELTLAMARASFLLLDVGTVEEHASEALRLAEQLQRRDLGANAIGWLARCRQAYGDLRGAIDMDRTAISRAPGLVTAAYMLGPLTLYLAGRSTEAIPLALDAAGAARSCGDTTFVMYALPHVGLTMSASGRYAEASAAFREARAYGRKYGALPMLARATAMAAGLHLSVFDFEGAEALQTEARELGQSVGFAPTVVSADIDALLTLARCHEPGRAETLLKETAAAAASTADWHQWLWQLRLTEARAELALARGAFDEAFVLAAEAVARSRAHGRPKYEALGLITRARALCARARTRDAIADATVARTIAEGMGDPALLLMALDVLIRLDGSDELATRARETIDRICEQLPDEAMRRSFSDAEIVRRIRTGR
jgi:DNA-binding winged helix-turn-helix (wHTH) protein/tetratricopeptide (TPR) repeat protein